MGGPAGVLAARRWLYAVATWGSLSRTSCRQQPVCYCTICMQSAWHMFVCNNATAHTQHLDALNRSPQRRHGPHIHASGIHMALSARPPITTSAGPCTCTTHVQPRHTCIHISRSPPATRAQLPHSCNGSSNSDGRGAAFTHGRDALPAPAALLSRPGSVACRFTPASCLACAWGDFSSCSGASNSAARGGCGSKERAPAAPGRWGAAAAAGTAR